jgi:hypothetical protein
LADRRWDKSYQFLISPEVWSYIAWMPTMHLVEFCEWLVADRTVGQPASGRMAVVLGSRLYFLVSLTGLYLVFKLIVYLTGRYMRD